MSEVMYRYEDHSGAVLLLTLPVVRCTAKGTWVDYYGTHKFVLGGTLKKFAAKDEAEARKSFFARKAKQQKILKAQLENIAAAVDALKHNRIGRQYETFEFINFKEQ